MNLMIFLDIRSGAEYHLLQVAQRSWIFFPHFLPVLRFHDISWDVATKITRQFINNQMKYRKLFIVNLFTRKSMEVLHCICLQILR